MTIRKISEKITAALKTVNCPYILNPVQLQGLDLPIIFQVLQWLVKKLLETRDERNEINRKNACSYFSTKFLKGKVESELKEDLDNGINKIDSKIHKDQLNLLSEVKYNYISTGRLYRPTNKQNFEYNDPLRVYFTLIEHGMNKDVTFQRALIDLLRKKNLIEGGPSGNLQRKQTVTSAGVANENTLTSTISTKEKEKEKELTITNEEKKKLEEIISTNIQEVSTETKNFQRVNTSVIEEIFSENIDSIITAIDTFENLKGDENVDRIKLFVKEKERLESKKNNIVYQVQEYETELSNLNKKKTTNSEEIDETNQEIFKLNSTYEENIKNLEKLNQKIKQAKISENKMKMIGEKIKQKEEIKLAITKFKKDCLEEKKSYDNQLEVLEKKIEKMNDSENTQVFEEIDRNYQNEYEKMVIKKKDLFEQNKIINLLTRKIQVFPSKLELIQYQKRFQELYDQINNVSEKSKKILNEINSQDEVQKLLNQKLEIFIQLKEAYKNSKSKKEKEEFKQSLNSVLDSISESLSKSTDRLRQVNKQIEQAQTKLNELQLYENKYMKLIKEYNKEYNKFNRAYS